MADQGLTEKKPGRRQYRRYKTNFPATLTTDIGEFQTHIIQISRGSCLVFSSILLFTDQRLI